MGQGSGTAVSYGAGCRRSSSLALLWLWCRPAAVAPVRPLAWEPPYAANAALKSQTNKKKILKILTCIDVTLPIVMRVVPGLHFLSSIGRHHSWIGKLRQGTIMELGAQLTSLRLEAPGTLLITSAHNSERKMFFGQFSSL